MTLAGDLCLTCPFEPSAYKAVGKGERLGIVIRVTDEIYDRFASLEEHCRNLLQAEGLEKVEGLWCQSAREDDFGKALRAKINIYGTRAADFWDPNNEIIIQAAEYNCLMYCVKYEGLHDERFYGSAF